MQVIKRYTVDEILTQARTTVAPLACEPIWSRDHDRLGFLIRDEKARRGVRSRRWGSICWSRIPNSAES
jgi:hypothetical protein